MNIYTYNEYKALLKAILLEKKSSPTGRRYTFQNMANTCRVQKTYLSKVLNVSGDLSADQLYLACEYLGFSTEQIDYMFLLYEENRCQLSKRKAELKERIVKIQKKYRQTDAHIKADVQQVTNEELSEYFLDPYLQLVHVFLTIDRFCQNPQLIRQELALTEAHFSLLLDKLVKMKFVVTKKDSYHVLKENMHLPNSSHLVSSYKVMLRLQAMEQISRLPKNHSYNFSVIFSTDKVTKDKIQNGFFDFLKKIEGLVHDSTPTDVYQLNFDLLPWSRSADGN
jgi:hypothetical protein